MSLPPAIIEHLTAAGMQMSAIETDATEAWERGEFIEDTFGRWLAKMKTEKSYCFIGDEQSDLEAQAFGNGNVSARGALVKKLGEQEATARATAWGLAGLHDYKTRGKRPSGEHVKKPGRDNPWSAEGWSITRQGQIAKANFTLATELAKAAGSFVGATRPARAA